MIRQWTHLVRRGADASLEALGAHHELSGLVRKLCADFITGPSRLESIQTAGVANGLGKEDDILCASLADSIEDNTPRIQWLEDPWSR